MCESGSYNYGMRAQEITVVVVFIQPRVSRCVSFNRLDESSMFPADAHLPDVDQCSTHALNKCKAISPVLYVNCCR